MNPAKDIFLAALNDLPEGLSDFLNTPIPNPPSIGVPGDVETAIIAQGVLSKYILDVFKVFVGFTPVEALMRISSKNITNQGILLAALEYIGAQGEASLIAPVNGGVYYGVFMTWKAELIRGGLEKMEGIHGGDTFEFTAVEERLFSADWPVPVGMHTAILRATFQGSVSEDTVSFEVKSFADVPTFPENGAVLSEPLEEIKFLTGVSTDDITDTVKISIDDEPEITMIKVSALGFTASVSVSPGQLHSISFRVGSDNVKLVQFESSTS